MSRSKEARPLEENRALAGPAILLCVAAGLAPVIGGKLAPDPQPLEPGFAPVLGSVLGGGQVPALAACVLTLLVAASFGWHWARSRVVQVPFPNIALCLSLLALAVAASAAYSGYKALGIAVAAQWLVFVLAFFAAAAGLGRRRGPLAVLASIVAGSFVAAAMGILEFQAARAVDPSWRIFSTWTNPNALAGMLLIGWFLALGLLASAERVAVFAAGAAVVVIGFAIVLTQSKGAFAAGLAGMLAFSGYCLATLRPISEARRFALPVIASIALLAALVAGVAFRKPAGTASGGPGLLTRIQSAQATQDQSAGFRSLLWKGSIELIRGNPIGYGAGSYRFVSTKPGLTPQTQNPHNGYLQLAVESGVLAGVLLLAFGALWLREAFRGARRMPTETALVRAGVVGAFFAAAAHNVVDSDLYYLGSGLALFLLMGAAMPLFGDALTPEQPHRSVRFLAFAAAFAAVLGAVVAAVLDLAKANALWLREQGSFDAASSRLQGVSLLEPLDGEVAAIRAALAPPAQRLRHLKDAAARSPSPKNLRSLARELAVSGDAADAERALREALKLDPNNLLALSQLLELQVGIGNTISAEQTAERIVGIEATDYFQVRAIPEIVPTETYSARRFLAERQPEPRRRIELLAPALKGFLEYLERTLPMVQRGLAERPPVIMPGERPDQVVSRLEEGARVAELLAVAYRTSGLGREASEAVDAASRFREAAASVPSPNR